MEKEKFKIAVLNIQLGVGVTKGVWQYFISGWKYFFPHTINFSKKISKFIQSEEIDIVAFLEVGERMTRGKEASQLQIIADMSGLRENIIFPDYKLWGIFSLSNAISANFDLINSKINILPGKAEQRTLCEALINIRSKKVKVLVAHLSLVKSVRKSQVTFIAEYIKEISLPLILAGDFNTDNDEELLPLITAGLMKIKFAKTFPSWNPKYSFNAIFISNELKFVNSYVPKNIVISDHLPLVAELNFV